MHHRRTKPWPKGRALIAVLGLALVPLGCGPDNEEVGLEGSQTSAPPTTGGPDYNSATSSEEAYRLSGPDGARGTPTGDDKKTP